ncbi:MAG: thioesterase family protein [Chloroflexota bacterium]
MTTSRQNYTFSHKIRVRFGEVDYQGIVFNANYLTYFDVVLTEYLRTAGIEYAPDVADREENDFNVVKSTLELKAPARADDLLDVCTRIGRIGRSSLTWELAIFRPGEKSPCTIGEIIWVYANQNERKSVPIPDELKQQLLSVGASAA